MYIKGDNIMANILLINLPLNGTKAHENSGASTSRYIQPPCALIYLAGRLVELDFIKK